jgi:TRAP-type C4-dicarboxylate transport system substrate-binding protein
MRKRRVLLGVSLVVLLLAGLCIPTNSVAGSSSKLHIKFSTWHPPMSREVQMVWIPMLNELKKRSNGRITHTMYAGSALASGPEHYDIVKEGRSDMGYFASTYTPGRFPLTDVLSLPVTVDNKVDSADIGRALYDRYLYKEYPGVKMMELNGCLSSYLWTKKPVRSLEDLKGLRIRAPGGHQSNCVKGLGAAVVFMPLSDVYMALDTGTIDGVVTCPPLVLAFKLYDVIKHGTVLTFGCISEGMIMNENTWKKTPDDLKPLVEEVCTNPFRTTNAFDAALYKKFMKEINDKGVELYYMPEKEANRWYARFQDNTRNWVAGLEKKGLPAKDVVIMWNEEVKKRGYKAVAFPPEWEK